MLQSKQCVVAAGEAAEFEGASDAGGAGEDRRDPRIATRIARASTRVRRKIESEAMAIRVAAQQPKSHIVDPRTSRWLPFWDVTTGLALGFTALFTPYEVAYLSGNSEVIFWINRGVDLIFLLDVFLNFFLAYPADAEQSSREGAQWVTSHRRIMRHYLTTWFCVDVLSVGTSVFDIIAFTSDSFGRKFMFMRVLRAARLFKLLRLLRGSRLLKRWETRVRINYGAVSLSSSMCLVVLFAHWSACGWMLQVFAAAAAAPDAATRRRCGPHTVRVPVLRGQVAFRTYLEDTWLYHHEYCIDDPTAGDAPLDLSTLTRKELRNLEAYTDGPPHDFDAAFVCLPHYSIFAGAFYWAVMTITSVGYGDIVATPRQASEQIVATVLMLAGAFVWSQARSPHVFVPTSTRRHSCAHTPTLPTTMRSRGAGCSRHPSGVASLARLSLRSSRSSVA
jgi:hypothetical protein